MTLPTAATPPSRHPRIMATGDLPFRTEYAKSNRSSCKLCRNNIDKESLRMAKMIQSPHFDGKIPNWYHFSCFFKIAKPKTIDDIGGMGNLRWDDQQKIKDKIGGGTIGGSESTDGPSTAATGSKRGRSQNSDGSKKPKVDNPLEQSMKEQNELIWKVRDELYSYLTNGQLKEMLEANGQSIKSGESNLLNACSDGMVFGAIQPCDTCGGQLVPHTYNYKCSGDISEWTKCTITTTEVKRKRWAIPDHLKDEFPFLKKYKYEKRVRVFPEAPSSSQSLSSLDSSTSATPSAPSYDPSQPLKGFRIRVIGKLGPTQKKVAAEIKDLGGSVVSSVTPQTTICISTKAEIDKGNQPMKDVEKCNVPVVDLEFLEDVGKGGNPFSKIGPHTISTWGASRLSLPTPTKQPDSGSIYEQVGKTVKMTVKGGAVVDPDSGLESTHHVLVKKADQVYSVVLGMVDVIRGTNSYYKLQILESDKGKNYRVFRSWGRVGTTIGGNKLENFYSSRDDALDEFKTLYYEKTGNSWSNRNNSKKVPGKFYPLEMDYGQDEDEDKKASLAEAGSRSKLAPEIQDLVKMIFDIESMKKALVEFEIDTKKMPLGKLSRRQIEKAYTVLSDLLKEIEGENNPARILDGSNQFYTLIPHDFGMQKPPLLDNEKMITNKTLMLDNLLEIEFAYSILKSGEEGETEEKDPLDVHFEKLATDMQVLPKSSTEFTNIVDYVKNTHGSTHSHYNLDVMEAFKITRRGEAKRFKPFSKFKNRMLLWHGSRLTNYVGILSQGLRIAPPEAPVTGYMFGKGVYFADMVSKSANYCWTSHQNPIGLMLLCEVALGDMYERTSAEFVTKLPSGKHCTKGVGRTTPDPSGFKMTDTDAVIPSGKPCPSTTQHTSLLYNEYIVYDVAQISMKYLVKMKFNYN